MGTEAQKNEAGAAQNPDLQVREKQAVTREPGTWQGAYFEPRVDIYETGDALTLTAEVPGAEADDLQTDLKDNLLTVSARVKAIDGKWKPLYEEYSVGHYLRQFRVGEQIDQLKISARLNDGVLTLTLPKAAAARPRRIKVMAG